MRGVFSCKAGTNHFDQEVERVDVINAASADDRGKSFGKTHAVVGL